MIRIIIFLCLIIFVAGCITALSSINTFSTAEILGNEITIHTGFLIGAVGVLLFLLVWFTSIIKDLLALPEKIRARRRQTQQTRGMAALARGIESVMVGDAVDAKHHARIAQRNLEQSSLTRLLTAQAAQLAGDDMEARENFTLMLEAPETEFLGLHGLYLQATSAGDKVLARQHAERAFSLRPNAKWAFESVLELNLERGAWGETKETLKTAKANNLITDDQARRGNAALLTADAYAAGLAGDQETALKEAEAAFRLSPELTPASILAASALADKGKKSRAAKILEQSFATNPHPAITKLYEEIFADDKQQKQVNTLKKLSQLAPETHEGKFLMARAESLAGNDRLSLELLEPLITTKPFAREFSAVADVISRLRDEEAARPWLERAARAPRSPEPGSNGKFNFTKSGWARLVREFMDHGRLCPPPLEDTKAIGGALSHEEVKMLAAPQMSDEVPDEEIDDEINASNDTEDGQEQTPSDSNRDASKDSDP